MDAATTHRWWVHVLGSRHVRGPRSRSCLSAEALVLVFKFLSLPERALAACVCKAWRAASDDDSLWQTLQLHDICRGRTRTDDQSLLLKVLSLAGQRLQELSLVDDEQPVWALMSDQTPSTNGLVDALIQGGCTKLRRLVCCTDEGSARRHDRGLLAGDVFRLVAACPNLRHLECIVGCRTPGEMSALALVPGTLKVVCFDCALALPAERLHLPRSVTAAAFLLDSESTFLTFADSSAASAVSSLSLCDGFNLSPDTAAALLDAIRKAPTLTTLCLRPGDMTNAVSFLPGLLDAVMVKSTLSSLSLDEIGLSRMVNPSVNAHMRLLAAHASLTRLDLADSAISGRGAVGLASGLRSNPTLRVLILNECRVETLGARAIANALMSGTCRLQQLALRDNNIAKAGLTALGRALASNVSLTALDVSYNRDGDGVLELVKGLRSNITLRRLGLNATNLGNAAAAELANIMRTNTALQVLSMGSNDIGLEGAAALAAALQVNGTLQALVMCGSRLGNSGAVHLARMLRTNRSLTLLNLSMTRVNVRGMRALAGALMWKNRSLRTLVVGHGHVDASPSSDSDSDSSDSGSESSDADRCMTCRAVWTEFADVLRENPNLTLVGGDPPLKVVRSSGRWRQYSLLRSIEDMEVEDEQAELDMHEVIICDAPSW